MNSVEEELFRITHDLNQRVVFLEDFMKKTSADSTTSGGVISTSGQRTPGSGSKGIIDQQPSWTDNRNRLNNGGGVKAQQDESNIVDKINEAIKEKRINAVRFNVM